MVIQNNSGALKKETGRQFVPPCNKPNIEPKIYENWMIPSWVADVLLTYLLTFC